MLDPDAVERRLHRLAILLLGDHPRAARVVDAVVACGAAPGDAHLDRLVILRSREVAGDRVRSSAALPGLDARTVAALDTLDFQAREAWMLAEVLGLDLRAVARTMDCSRSAAAQHLTRAQGAFGTAADAARAAVRAAIVRVGVPPSDRRRRLVRRRMRHFGRWLIGLLVAAAGVAGYFALRRLWTA